MVSCFNEHPPVVRASPYEYTNSALRSRKEVAGAVFAVMELAAKHSDQQQREALKFVPESTKSDAEAAQQLFAESEVGQQHLFGTAAALYADCAGGPASTSNARSAAQAFRAGADACAVGVDEDGDTMLFVGDGDLRPTTTRSAASGAVERPVLPPRAAGESGINAPAEEDSIGACDSEFVQSGYSLEMQASATCQSDRAKSSATAAQACTQDNRQCEVLSPILENVASASFAASDSRTPPMSSARSDASSMVSCFNEHPPVVRASPYEYTNSTLGSRKEVAGAAFAVMEQAAKHHGRPEREALVFLPQRIEGDAGASEQLAAAPSGSSHAAAHVADFTGADGEVNVSAFADIARSSCAEAARCAALRARIMDREAACESATGSTAESLLSAAGASNAHSANPKHPVATRMIERLFKEDEEAAELDGRVAGTQSEVGALVEAGAMELRVVDYFNQLTSPEAKLAAVGKLLASDSSLSDVFIMAVEAAPVEISSSLSSLLKCMRGEMSCLEEELSAVQAERDGLRNCVAEMQESLAVGEKGPRKEREEQGRTA